MSFQNKEINYSNAVQELWYFKGEEVSCGQAWIRISHEHLNAEHYQGILV